VSSAVGVNWMNSRSAIAAPARAASARPWPKDPAGFVPCRNNPPMPSGRDDHAVGGKHHRIAIGLTEHSRHLIVFDDQSARAGRLAHGD
jgi:hypothetical protein